MIKAKFAVSTVMHDSYGNETVQLHAVYGKDGTANASWAKATPGGNLNMTISNPNAQGFFQPGKEYFLKFEAAEIDVAEVVRTQ